MNKFLFMICLLLASHQILPAASRFYESREQFIKTQWTTEDGLPQNTINSIVQTKDGYLWMATFGGLARFDGVKFRVFDSTNSPGLSDNRFVSLYEDQEGILWITAQYGNIYTYRDGEFENVRINRNKSDYFLQRENDGSFWIVEPNKIVKYGFAAKGQTNPVITEVSIEEINPLARNNLVVKDSMVWYIEKNGRLKRKNMKTGEVIEIASIPPAERALEIINNPVDPGILILTQRRIGRINDKELVEIYRSASAEEFRNSGIFLDSENVFWCLTEKRLFRFEGENIENFEISRPEGSRPGRFLQDTEGNFWVGSTSGGLFRFKKSRIKTFCRIYNDELISTNSVIEDARGTIWVSSKGLLSIRNEELDLVWQEGVNPGRSTITSINIDRQGNLWFGALNGFYSFINGKSQFFEDPDLNSLQSAVNSIYFDSKDDMWVGRSGGLQLFQNGRYTTFRVENGLVDDRVNCIIEAKNGDLWIGTGGGISQYRNDRFTNFTTAQGLSNDSIRDIFEDPDGTLWIGTYGGGINRLRDGKFSPITIKNGLPENIASSILLDDNDNFWILGNRGIYSVSRKMLNEFADGMITNVVSSVYDTSDGMVTSEGNGINQYSGWKAKDGTLWFTMVQGVVAIDPTRKSDFAPRIYLEDITVENKLIQTGNSLNLRYDQSDIQVNYTGLSFTKPENIQFRYKLAGLENQWNFVGKRRTLYFSFLPAGNYDLILQAMSADGTWSAEKSILKISVEEPFWRTGRFYLLCSLLFLLLIALLFSWRIRKIQAEKRHQQYFSRQLINAHETERNRIASDLHDSLGQNLLIIKNWALIAQNNLNDPEEIKKQLKEISEFSSNALEETRSIAKDLMPVHLKRFGLTETLVSMINRICATTDLHIAFEIDEIDGLLSERDQLSLYRIIQEAVNNIIKHSGSSEALIEIKHIENKLSLRIKDFGRGFEFQNSNLAGEDQHGFGLNSIVERVNLLNGKIKIDSDLGKGTEINILIKI